MLQLEKIWPKWHVVEEIGNGSFGKVYKIRREDIGGEYFAALKVISIPKDRSEIEDVLAEGMDLASATDYYNDMMAEIVREFALMEELKGNTNIVGYEDHEVIMGENGLGGDIYIRMELLTPLNTYMRSHPFTEKDVIKLGTDLCQALVLCENRNIIHRDIKPENIFVSKDGNYKLGDFGVARTADKTMSGMSIKGTVSYMAPEVYKGQEYNHTVDIYSLGIVMYRLLNDNRVPFMPPAPTKIMFSDREEAQTRRMKGEAMPKPVHASEEMSRIILKACEYDRKDRWQTAEEMMAALRECGSGDSARTSGVPSVLGVSGASGVSRALGVSGYSENSEANSIEYDITHAGIVVEAKDTVVEREADLKADPANEGTVSILQEIEKLENTEDSMAQEEQAGVYEDYEMTVLAKEREDDATVMLVEQNGVRETAEDNVDDQVDDKADLQAVDADKGVNGVGDDYGDKVASNQTYGEPVTGKKKKNPAKVIIPLVLVAAVVVGIVCAVNRNKGNDRDKIAITADDFTNSYIGGYVTFGVYEQDGNKSNGPEPIEWEVLDINENGMLLVSRYVLDAQPYNMEYTDVTWETCTLRSWLNNDFLNAAFDSSEQSRINTTYVVNADNSYYGTEGGNDTYDKIFCLSVDEILRYYQFNTYYDEYQLGYCQRLITEPTQYAINKGAWTWTMLQEDYNNYYASEGYSTDVVGKVGAIWWLRSPGGRGNCACNVFDDGRVGADLGFDVADDYFGVRPALYVQP